MPLQLGGYTILIYFQSNNLTWLCCYFIVVIRRRRMINFIITYMSLSFENTAAGKCVLQLTSIQTHCMMVLYKRRPNDNT